MASVAGIYRGLCLESVKNKYECEIQAACQHWEVRGPIGPVGTLPLPLRRCLCDRRASASQSEKLLLFDTVQSELEEKIRRLEEDRHSIDITSGSTDSALDETERFRITAGKTDILPMQPWKFSGLSPASPELWNDGLHSRKNKKKDPFCAVKKKKPVVVSDILSPELPVVLFLWSFVFAALRP